MQEGKVIAYESRKLKEHEKKYSAYDLELAAIIRALTMWHHYLMGKKFILMTDHHSLTSYLSQPTLNVRQERWVYFLSGFYFNIKYLKGKGVANALSRKVYCLYEISCNKRRITFDELIKKTTEQDSKHQQIGQQVQNPTSK